METLALLFTVKLNKLEAQNSIYKWSLETIGF